MNTLVGLHSARILLKRFRVAVLTVTVACGAAQSAFGQGQNQPARSSIDDAELVIQWRQLQNSSVSVEGDFWCQNDTACEFLPRPELGRAARVDIKRLSYADKYNLVLYCHGSCRIIVRGVVTEDALIASEIYDLWGEIAMQRSLRGLTGS